MKILFLLQDLPFPVSDGMRWKMFHLLRYMSTRHECHVIAFSFDRDPNLDAVRRELPGVNWLAVVPTAFGPMRWLRAGLCVLSGRPASLARFRNTKFEDALRGAIQRCRYDVIHYDIVNLVQFHVPGIPSVHSPNDATSLFYSRMASNADYWPTRLKLAIGAALLGRYERQTYANFSRIHVVSKVDAEFLRTTTRGAEVVYIPFGVAADVADLTAAEADMAPDDKLVLVLGGANVPGVAAGIEEFVRIGIPEMARQVPGLKVRIQGRGTDVLMQQIGLSWPNVEASAWVDDLDALIRSAAVIVLPDKAGTGIKTRALQALACGAPVVGTTVAFEGIREYVSNGRHCMIADSIPAVADAVVALLGDEGKRRLLGREAAILAHDQLSWERLGPQYEDLYRAAAETAQSIARPGAA